MSAAAWRAEEERQQAEAARRAEEVRQQAEAARRKEEQRRQAEAARWLQTPQVFRAGDPVERSREAFVPRFRVLGELENQLMLANGCPGLILYGRRRTGKSTIFRNLVGFLPDSVAVTGISMQDPRAFTSTQTLVDLLSELLVDVFDLNVDRLKRARTPLLPTEEGIFSWRWLTSLFEAKGRSKHSKLAPRPIRGNPGSIKQAVLPELFRTLMHANERLANEERRLLLTIDEYENLDSKIGEGAFSMDLLALVRQSIQDHHRIIWVFAGSHHVAELRNAPWSSYLVSARTVEVPLFSPEETRLILTDPLFHSGFWRESELDRPRFEAERWGRNGIEQIYAEAGGWPHLVQLIAETVVDLLNQARARDADGSLLEKAFSRAVVRGDTALRELVLAECLVPGEWEYVKGFRTCDTQRPPDDEAIHRSCSDACSSLKKMACGAYGYR